MIMPMNVPDIAVIGAGVAGLACAERLAEHGLQVHVFDKGRQPGGRVASRQRLGIVLEHGAPGEATLVGDLARRVPVACGTRVTRLVQTSSGHWRLHAGDAVLPGTYGGVVVAAPAPQAAELLAPAPALAAAAAGAVMRPVLTALVVLPGPLGRNFSSIRFSSGPLAEARRQQSRRTVAPEGWILHATPEFSRDNVDGDPGVIGRYLWDRFRSALDLVTTEPLYLRGHRWRYGRTQTPLGRACLHDDHLALGACGDWCLGDSIEDALASGRALASRILGIPEHPQHQVFALRKESA
jgi:renalase